MRCAQDWWHWWFLGQTAKPAERVISADPDAWYSTPKDYRAHQAEEAPDEVAAAILGLLAHSG